jgi:hypothetical protein
MSRDDWVMAFCDTLRELQPYLSLKLAWTVALVEHKEGTTPHTAARQYHKRTLAMEASARSTKRSK